MGWQPIPVEYDVSLDLSEELVKELEHVAAADGFPRVEPEVEVAGGRDDADGADACPVVRVGQDGRHSGRCPGSMDEGRRVESAFIPESIRDATRH